MNKGDVVGDEVENRESKSSFSQTRTE